MASLAFIVFTVIFLVVSEVFTILFQLTGLSREKARFQVLSLLTGTGFTTKESELITLSKIRRRLAQYIMIFGFCSTATLVTMLLTTIKYSYNIGFSFIAIGLTAVFIFIIRTTKLGDYFDKLIESAGNKLLFGANSNMIVVKEAYGKNVIAEINLVNMPNNIEGKTLQELDFANNYDMLILAIVRDKEIIEKIKSYTVLKSGDTITVFGNLAHINKLFTRLNNGEKIVD